MTGHADNKPVRRVLYAPVPAGMHQVAQGTSSAALIPSEPCCLAASDVRDLMVHPPLPDQHHHHDLNKFKHQLRATTSCRSGLDGSLASDSRHRTPGQTNAMKRSRSS